MTSNTAENTAEAIVTLKLNGLTSRLNQYRTQVVEQGTAKLLNDLDQIILEFNDKKNVHVMKNYNSTENFIFGILGLIAILLPWVYGVYHFIKLVF